MIEQIVFPLGVPQFGLMLPKTCRLEGVVIERDITSLRVEHDEGKSILGISTVGKDGKKFLVRSYFEGDTIAGEDGTEYPVPIPEDGFVLPDGTRKLRKLGVVETKETPAVWHIYEVIQNPTKQHG